MRRTNESGSVLGFILVAVVLAGLLIGGAYFINRQQKGQSNPPPSQQQEKPPKEGQDKQGPPPAEPGNRTEGSSTPQTTPQAGVAHELPATGPGETVGSLLVLGLVTGLGLSYIRSRRAYLSL